MGSNQSELNENNNESVRKNFKKLFAYSHSHFQVIIPVAIALLIVENLQIISLFFSNSVLFNLAQTRMECQFNQVSDRVLPGIRSIPIIDYSHPAISKPCHIIYIHGPDCAAFC